MRLRWLRLVLVAVSLATASLVVTAAPAHASPNCSIDIEWYQNRYEVTASNIISCNSPMREVYVQVWMTKQVRYYEERLCESAWGCNTAAFNVNKSGIEQYCATAQGSYRITQHDFLPYLLGPISECINA